MPPARVIETRPAVELTNPSEGVYIFDLGADDHRLVPAAAAGAGRRDGHAAARDLFIWGRDVGRAQ